MRLLRVIEGELGSAKRATLAAGLIVMWAMGYFGAPWLTHGNGVFNPATQLDSRIPCMSELVWIYLLGLVLPIMPVGLVPTKLFMRAVSAYVLVIVWATLAFLVLPTDGQALRAQCAASVGVLGTLREWDPPANLFPSLHVAFAVTAALLAHRSRSRWTPFLAAMSCVEAACVCLVKQHFILDAVAGAVVAFIADFAAFTPMPTTRSDGRYTS